MTTPVFRGLFLPLASHAVLTSGAFMAAAAKHRGGDSVMLTMGTRLAAILLWTAAALECSALLPALRAVAADCSESLLMNSSSAGPPSPTTLRP